MLEGMSRVSIVSSVAAAVVLIGHFAYHLTSRGAQRPGTAQAPVTLQSAAAPPLPVVQTEPLVARPCRLEPPLTVADRKPMLDALRPLVAREEVRYPYLAGDARELLRRFEACSVDVHEFRDYVLVAVPLGGYWTGARFRKTPRGWIALQLDGGDIR
jgi:hypothetical protein